jgi:hypothetical protein
MARPAWKPTAKEREAVKTMTGYGIPQDAICAILKVTRRRAMGLALDVISKA